MNGENMENEGTIIIPIIGYIIAVISPIIGLLYGAALVFFKKDTPLYQKHGRFIIYFAIVVFIISFIIKLVIK
jgi:hypothetical protein